MLTFVHRYTATARSPPVASRQPGIWQRPLTETRGLTPVAPRLAQLEIPE